MDSVFSARGISFTYKKNRPLVIENLDLDLYPEETAALVGGNGTGKTTLGKLLMGILKPDQGEITLFGRPAAEYSLGQTGKRVGYCFQNPDMQLFTLSVEEEIGFGLRYQGTADQEIRRITEELLELFEISHLRKKFPLNLSWGEKRRVVLAACMALSPEYLILDEPTTGLDRERVAVLNRELRTLRGQGVGMLLVSHNEEFVSENATRVLKMDQGRIVYDGNA